MKKVLFFILVGVVYICIALGFSWSNNNGSLDNGLRFLGLQANSAVAAETFDVGVGVKPDSGPSNIPIPPPPYPEPTYPPPKVS